MRELMGELMISSNAGTTLPEPVTVVSIVPLSTVATMRSSRLTLVRMTSIRMTMTTASPAKPVR